ncbi:MAG: hypothetical protein WBV94_28335 [Blastocatellia bacterium]
MKSTVITNESGPLDDARIAFDAEDMDSPAVESSRQNKLRHSKRIIGALLLLLLVASVAVALYFMTGGNRSRLDVNVRDTRPQAEKSSAARQNPDDVTSQAIAEVRSATNEAKPPVTQLPDVTAGASQVSPNAPVTVPLDGPGGTVSPPVLSVPTLPGERTATGTTSTPSPTEITHADGASNTGTVTPSRRNPEHSIRCAPPASSNNQQNQPLSKIRLNEPHLQSLSRRMRG